MKTINNKKFYKRNGSKKKNKYVYKGGNQSLVSMIQSNPTYKVVGPKDTVYPQQYIGFNVFLPPLNVQTLLKDSVEEGGYLEADGSLNLFSLDQQVLIDIKRLTIIVNQMDIYNEFLQFLKDPNTSQNLTDLQPETDSVKFKENILKLFPSLNVSSDELNVIELLANQNLENDPINYWAIIPFYDEILNKLNITENQQLNKYKILSQQNISKTILDVLHNIVIPSNIFYQSIVISGSFHLFDDNTKDYIKNINTELTINMTINEKDQIVENNIYLSLIHMENEFGLGIINSTIYMNLNTNELYIFWKIEKWRNEVIKMYYKWLMKQNPPLSLNILNQIQTFIYDNEICDDYPLTHKNLFKYIKTYFTISEQKKYTEQEIIQNIKDINTLISSSLDKNKKDTYIANLINKKIISLEPLISRVKKIFFSNSNSKEDLQDSSAMEMDASNNNILSEGEGVGATETNNILSEGEGEGEGIDTSDASNNILGDTTDASNNILGDTTDASNNILGDTSDASNNILSEATDADNSLLASDQQKISNAEEQLNAARSNYSADQLQIQNSNPNNANTNNLTSKLATFGSVAALGAIGTGLMYAAPLLLGGKKKNKTKKKRLLHK